MFIVYLYVSLSPIFTKVYISRKIYISRKVYIYKGL